MDDNALSLLSAVGASSPSGPAAIAPATDNGTVQAMLKAYGLPAPVGAPSDDLLTGNGSTSNSSLYGPLSPNQSQANVSPSTSPAQTLPVTPSGAPQTSSTTTSDTTGAEPFDPVASAQKHRAAADVIFGGKDGNGDALRKQYNEGVNPFADAYSQSLSASRPQFQQARLSPLAMIGLALAGGAANGMDKFNNPGTNLASNAVGAMNQASQNAFERQKEDYAQQLQNAQAQYGLAKDRNAPLLSQAEQADQNDANNETQKQQYTANAILSDKSIDASKKAEVLKEAHDQVMQDRQNKWAEAASALDNQRTLHRDVIQQYAKNGNKQGLADLMVEDFMDGKPHDGQGNPLTSDGQVDHQALAHIAQIRADALAQTPKDLADALELKNNQLAYDHGVLLNKQAQKDLENSDALFNAKMKQAAADYANTKAQTANVGSQAALGYAQLAEGKRQFGITNPQEQERVSSSNYIAGTNAYNNAIGKANTEVETTRKALADARAASKGMDFTSDDVNHPNTKIGSVWKQIQDADAEYKSALARRDSIQPNQFMYHPATKPTGKPSQQDIAKLNAAAAAAIKRGKDPQAVNALLQKLINGG